MAFPGTYNFNYYRGDTMSFILNPKDSVGDPWSLTGYTADFTIADKRGAGATQYSGTATIDTVNNIVTCTITPIIGRSITPGTTWVYDVQITYGSTIYTLLTGTITSTDDITGAV
jgi:hypothetical protein